jgi:pro-apoptotic serine protease NMA111
MWLFVLLVGSAFADTPVDLSQEGARWQKVLEGVTESVVALRVDITRGFDTNAARSTLATGFIVDAERGLILTNRHVVQPGPIVAEAVFLDNEEVPVEAVYRDPVHDFGILRFDPKAVRFLHPQAIPLRPDRARVGTEIRVVGNDAGEKISILAGTLARLDRKAPDYGQDNFNDFNTFYYQAASSTSGGSSGAPVVDITGAAIALNAGGRRDAASSYYLPLDRVVRALTLIQEGKPVTRGTIEATFEYTTFDEVRRLGLSADTEARYRKLFPDVTGLLVVDDALPGGPGAAVLDPGDVLLTIDGAPLASFVPLEEVLDDKVGKTVHLEVERRGALQAFDVPVVDLHAITPSAYLEVGDSTLNDLSYQQARNHAIPLGGVYVASAGYMFDRAGIANGAVITEVAGAPIADIGALESTLAAYGQGAEVTVRFFNVSEPQRTQVATLIVERMLFPMRRCARPPEGGRWTCADSPPPPAPTPREPRTTSFPEIQDKVAKRVQASLVSIRFDIPYRVEGVYGTRFHGTGLVVDAAKGLVVTDRDTIPVALGDVRISIAGSVEIPARVVYLHPEHNIAVLRYDPALLGDTPVVSATLSTKDLGDGDRLWLVGISGGDELAVRRTLVDRVAPLYLPLPSPPFFSDKNLDVVVLSDATATSGGVLVDRKGRVEALWASFPSLNANEPHASYYGIPIAMVQDILPQIEADALPTWRSLGLSLGAMTVADARKRGLDEDWARRIEARAGPRRQVLTIGRRTVGTQAAELLRDGDLLLALDGEPATSFRDVERASQSDEVSLTVLRDGKTIDLQVPTETLDGEGTDRVLMWAGTVLHEPHAALPSQRGIPPVGVYVAWYWYGSPAGHYALRPTQRIVAVDGEPTPDLDAFLAAVKDKPDRGTVMLQLVDLDGRPSVMTLVLDLQYWPTYEIDRDTDGSWKRAEIPSATASMP